MPILFKSKFVEISGQSALNIKVITSFRWLHLCEDVGMSSTMSICVKISVSEWLWCVNLTAELQPRQRDASCIDYPSDAGEEDENDGDGGDGNNGGNNKKKGKKKQNLLGLVVDGEEAARLQKRGETVKADVCYVLVSSLPVNHRKLVQGLLCPYVMWQAIEGHFGTRDPTDYASSYTGVFRYRLKDAENPEMFVLTLGSNIITFERVIDTKLSDIFKSMILQHALPTSWEYIVRGLLGQAKILSFIKLMKRVSSELKRRRLDGSGQDKGNGEKAYAAVETKPVGAIVERGASPARRRATQEPDQGREDQHLRASEEEAEHGQAVQQERHQET
ncbi:unnamed protein product [Phytophthora fragariaefolia]|uniref:Unnamed protein product n=1 Tax=Phytophthora fragariaefolia TaxID=1490495 RepID=A0A9W6XCC0_9STRA|nr:unnamed protein product [Phytophthora fragariaefolia]